MPGWVPKTGLRGGLGEQDGVLTGAGATGEAARLELCLLPTGPSKSQVCCPHRTSEGQRKVARWLRCGGSGATRQGRASQLVTAGPCKALIVIGVDSTVAPT